MTSQRKPRNNGSATQKHLHDIGVNLEKLRLLIVQCYERGARQEYGGSFAEAISGLRMADDALARAVLSAERTLARARHRIGKPNSLTPYLASHLETVTAHEAIEMINKAGGNTTYNCFIHYRYDWGFPASRTRKPLSFGKREVEEWLSDIGNVYKTRRKNGD